MSDEELGRLEILPLDDSGNNTCMTFVLNNEDHTLGNALRYMLMKNPEVAFCGYSVPHPSESKINLRIQTRGSPATEMLKKALGDLYAVYEHMLNTFEKSVEDFKTKPSSAEVAMET
eukprot:Em0022g209a